MCNGILAVDNDLYMCLLVRINAHHSLVSYLAYSNIQQLGYAKKFTQRMLKRDSVWVSYLWDLCYWEWPPWLNRRLKDLPGWPGLRVVHWASNLARGLKNKFNFMYTFCVLPHLCFTTWTCKDTEPWYRSFMYSPVSLLPVFINYLPRCSMFISLTLIDGA